MEIIQNMFDFTHSIYVSVSFIIIFVSLLLADIFIKKQQQKDNFLRFLAIITVIIHFSVLWVDYLGTGSAAIEDNMIFMIYPCNIAMWLLLIYSLFINKDTPFAKNFAVFIFYIGLFGGVIGLVFNINYFATPDLGDYHVLKGLLSHVTMLAGCIYLLTGKYIKISMKNLIPVTIGSFAMFVHGYALIALFRVYNIYTPNIMFLIEKPFPEYPFISIWTIILAAFVLLFTFLHGYECIKYKKEDRWYNKFIKDRN